MANNFVDETRQAAYDPTDLQAVIRAGKIPAKQAAPPVDELPDRGAPHAAAKVSDREDEEAQQAYAKERRNVVQRLEQEHYQHSQAQSSQGSMASLLNQPYCPPPMVFTQRVAAPPERAILTKAATLAKSATTTKGQTLTIVREAMDLQE